VKNCNLPSRQQCRAILERYHVPRHIRRHCEGVARLAVALGRRIVARGEPVNLELVESAGLLHDMLRICDCKDLNFDKFDEPVSKEDIAVWQRLREQYGDVRHEDAAYEELRGQYPELAVVVLRHKYTAIIDPDQHPQSWEDKLVYYADKRVMHDRVVSLRQRLVEGHRRNSDHKNGEIPERIKKIDNLIFELEAEILAAAGLELEDTIC